MYTGTPNGRERSARPDLAAGGGWPIRRCTCHTSMLRAGRGRSARPARRARSNCRTLPLASSHGRRWCPEQCWRARQRRRRQTAARRAAVRTRCRPSRAGDFLTCPLLYRFRVIDRLPEPPSPAAARGTLVHAVLERLFDEPAAGRTPEAARSLLGPEWDRLLAAEPELAGLFAADEERGVTWLAEAAAMLDRYFTLEDPRRLEPAHRELCVEADAGVRAAAARLHRPAGRRARRRDPDRRLQDRHRARGPSSRPGRCSR